MSRQICSNCGNEITESEFCLHCGMALTDQARNSPNQRAIRKQTKELPNSFFLLLLCLCLTPIGGLIFLFLFSTFFFF